APGLGMIKSAASGQGWGDSFALASANHPRKFAVKFRRYGRSTADYVRFTPKADIGTQPRNVRFVPKADIGPKSLIEEDYVPAPGMKQRICVSPYRSL